MFMFRLALALGMTVSELSQRMSSRELSEWMAFWSIEPFGDVRADLRAAQITQAAISPHIKEGHKVPEIHELALFGDRSNKQQSLDEMQTLCKTFAKSFRA